MTEPTQKRLAEIAALGLEAAGVNGEWGLQQCDYCHKLSGCGGDSVPFATDDLEQWMTVPEPKSLFCLFIFLHECGHAVHRDSAAKRQWSVEGLGLGLERQKRVLAQEVAASTWARAFLLKHGVVTPDCIWQDAMRHAGGGAPSPLLLAMPGVLPHNERKRAMPSFSLYKGHNFKIDDLFAPEPGVSTAAFYNGVNGTSIGLSNPLVEELAALTNNDPKIMLLTLTTLSGMEKLAEQHARHGGTMEQWDLIQRIGCEASQETMASFQSARSGDQTLIAEIAEDWGIPADVAFTIVTAPENTTESQMTEAVRAWVQENQPQRWEQMKGKSSAGTNGSDPTDPTDLLMGLAAFAGGPLPRGGVV